MAYYGTQFRLRYKAWNTADNIPVAGDSGNHAITLRRDGTDAAFAGAKADLGGGDYEAVVSATLAQAYEISGRGTSSTADVRLFFEPPIRTVRLPNLAPGQAFGLPILDADGNWLTAGQQATLEATATEETLLAVKAKADTIGTGSAFVVSPINPTTGRVTIVRGDSYGQLHGRPAIPFPAADDAPDLSEAILTFTIRAPRKTAQTEPEIMLSATGNDLSVTADAKQTVYVSLTAAKSASATVGNGACDVQAVWPNGDTYTVAGPGLPACILADQSQSS